MDNRWNEGVRTLFAESVIGKDNLPGRHDAEASPAGGEYRREPTATGPTSRRGGE